MDSLAVLVLLAMANVVSSTVQCKGGEMTMTAEDSEHLHIFAQVHKVVNLTLHCVPVSLAKIAVRLHAEGLQDRIQTDHYCKYTFTT
ncbi:hypothetical protein Q1695_003552 [Nippostrongylus brasiliensis]|nr:hypothetical protein Q1695_003552 [Nippostrongylus brasiliensis]